MPAENAGRAFALVLVDELVRRGVRHAVLAPGSRSTPIALAMLENLDITVHVRIDERSAAYLALGIAKASRQVVPLLCTSGTATSYFHGAVMEADLSRVPLLVLTADRPPELHGIGANQTVTQQGMYGDAVRWAPVVATPESAPDSVATWRALVAETVTRCLGLSAEPAGPVHLNLPLREPLIATDDGIGFAHELGLSRAATAIAATPASATTLPDELVAALASARQGVVVAGGWDTESADAVVEFAARVRWPLIAEPHSNARRGPAALRSTDALVRDADFVAAHAPDLVVVIGRIGLSRALMEWLTTVPHVVISPDAGPWDVTRTARAVYSCSSAGLADIEITPADPEWLAAWQAASTRVSDGIDATLDASPSLTEPAAARDVVALLPDDATLVVSSSMPIRDLDLVMRPRAGVRIVANRGVSGIDGFISTAQGVALAQPAGGGPVVALCGDLSFLHDINGLLPGPDQRPDVTYVVINNDGGGIFSLLPQGSAVPHETFERVFGTPHGMSIEALATAYQLPYQLALNRDDLTIALHSYDGSRVIEVRTDRVTNTELHGALRQITPGTA